MEKYLKPHRPSRLARSAPTLPPKPFEVEYAQKDGRVRRVDRGMIEATHRIDFDGEYDLRFALPGERKGGEAVKFGFWMDGKLIHSMEVETKPSGLVYFSPYSEAAFRLYLPAGDHLFRAGFMDDDYSKTCSTAKTFTTATKTSSSIRSYFGPFPQRSRSRAAKRS